MLTEHRLHSMNLCTVYSVRCTLTSRDTKKYERTKYASKPTDEEQKLNKQTKNRNKKQANKIQTGEPEIEECKTFSRQREVLSVSDSVGGGAGTLRDKERQEKTNIKNQGRQI